MFANCNKNSMHVMANNEVRPLRYKAHLEKVGGRKYEWYWGACPLTVTFWMFKNLEYILRTPETVFRVELRQRTCARRLITHENLQIFALILRNEYKVFHSLTAFTTTQQGVGGGHLVLLPLEYYNQQNVNHIYNVFVSSNIRWCF